MARNVASAIVTVLTLVAIVIGIYYLYRYVTTPKGYRCVGTPGDPSIKRCEGGNTPEHNKTLEECKESCRGKGWKCSTDCEFPKCCELRNDVLVDDVTVFEDEEKCAENCTYTGFAPNFAESVFECPSSKIDCYKGFVWKSGKDVEFDRPCYLDSETCESKHFKSGYSLETRCKKEQRCRLDDPTCQPTELDCLKANSVPGKFKCLSKKCIQACLPGETCFDGEASCQKVCNPGDKAKLQDRSCNKCDGGEGCVEGWVCTDILRVMNRLEGLIDDFSTNGYNRIQAQHNFLNSAYKQGLDDYRQKAVNMMGEVTTFSAKDTMRVLVGRTTEGDDESLSFGFVLLSTKSIIQAIEAPADKKNNALEIIDGYMKTYSEVNAMYDDVSWP